MASGAFKPPYPPSWVDRFGAWVDRLPGPSLLYYILIGLAVFTTDTLLQWQAGTFPVGTFAPLHLALAGAPPVLFWAMQYLDKVADRALLAYRPVLRDPRRTYPELQYRLTTMPGRPLLWTGIAAIGINLLQSQVAPLSLPFRSLQIATTPVSLGLNGMMLVAVWCVGGAMTYHTLRQLSLVSRIYTEHTRVDLLNPGPFYALSRVTATTSMGLIVTYLWFLAAPGSSTLALKLFGAATLGGLALVTFVVPLLGAHRVLAEEKGRRLSETSDRLGRLIGDLHRGVDSGHLRGMGEMSQAIAGLEVERNLLEKAPTWPWEPQTVRGLIAAFLLPVLVWMVQLFLTRMLGV